MIKGSKHSEEAREKMRTAKLGKPGNPHKKGVPISKNAVVSCILCGVVIENTHVNRKRCDECRKKFDRKRLNIFKKENITKIRKENNEYWKRIRSEFPERRAELIRRSREYRENNKEYFRKKSRAWRRNNPGLKRQLDNQRRVLKLNAEGSHTLSQFYNVCEANGWTCFYCGELLNKKTVSRDHKIPLSRGGSDSIENIVPACMQCNRVKNSKTVDEFLEYKRERKKA